MKTRRSKAMAFLSCVLLTLVCASPALAKTTHITCLKSRATGDSGATCTAAELNKKDIKVQGNKTKAAIFCCIDDTGGGLAPAQFDTYDIHWSGENPKCDESATADVCMGTDTGGELLNYKLHCHNKSLYTNTIHVDSVSCSWDP